MTPVSSSSSTKHIPLIKGYLPLRLRIPVRVNPGRVETNVDDINKNSTTFMFVKEHQSSAVTSNEKRNEHNRSSTLFVTNVPSIPGIKTELLLRSIFGRFADVSRVTVVPNPRRKLGWEEWWTSHDGIHPCTFLPLQTIQKFAHVVFPSRHEFQKCWKHMANLISSSSAEPSLILDAVELQTLTSVTSEKNALAVAACCRRTMRTTAEERAELMEACNQAMASWEAVEQEAQLAQWKAAQQPDEDGFVTVSYSGAGNNDVDKTLVEAGTHKNNQKRHSQKAGRHANRNKKRKMGSSPLDDFYRFQTKEHRKKSLHELRERFLEDLKKVEQIKEEKQNYYRPF